MALIVPHQSQQGIQTANGGQAAQYRSASAFTTPGQENFGRGLQQLAHGMNKLGGVIFDAEIQKRQEQMELTLLEDMQKFQKESQAWSDNYQKNFQGKDALNAEADAQTFYKEKVDSLRQRWNGNERAQLYIQRNAGGVAVSGVNSMRDYGNKQQEVWKDTTFAGKKAQFEDIMSDWQRSPEDKQRAHAEFTGQYISYLVSKGMDTTAARIQTDKIYREAMSTGRQQSFLGKLNSNDLAGAAIDLATMQSGDAADFAAQYESGPAGSKAIGYDGTGGTSYGKFQISSKAGTFDDWLGWLDKNGHKAVAEELRAAGPADTGSRSGKMVNAWQALVASGAITDEMQRQFIQESHIEPALSKLPEHMRGAIQSDAGLYQAFFSTAVQHGAGGAVKLFTRNWDKGNGDKDAFLDALVADRETQFASSTPEVQRAISSRLARERAAYGMGKVSPEKVRAFQNMYDSAVKEKLKTDREVATLGTYAALNEDIKGLPPDQQDAVYYSAISGIEDRETRNQLRTMREADRALIDKKQASLDTDLAQRFETLADEQKLSYAQQLAEIHKLKELGLSEEGERRLRERLEKGRDTETKDNIKQTDNLLRYIDEGKIKTPEQVDEFAFVYGLTKGQIGDVKKYLGEGGQEGALWQARSKVDAAMKFYNNGKGLDKDPDFYRTFQRAIEPGQKLTDDYIRRTVRTMLLEEGERKGSGNIRIGYGDNMTYGEAVAAGHKDDWLPDVDDKTAARIRGEYRQFGINDLTDMELRWIRRKELGLPVPEDKIREWGTK